MKAVMVRYKVKADKAEENKQLIRSVFEELKTKQPAGIRYATFVFPDAVSFVHIAFIETTDGSNPLTMTNAFKAFQQNIKDRCEDPPLAMDLTEVGSFNFFN